MLRTIRTALTFYKTILPSSVIISGVSLFVAERTDFNLFMMAFWAKIIITALVCLAVSEYKRQEFYYYQNLGISRKMLWTIIGSLDIFIFLLLAFLVYNM